MRQQPQPTVGTAIAMELMAPGGGIVSAASRGGAPLSEQRAQSLARADIAIAVGLVVVTCKFDASGRMKLATQNNISARAPPGS